MRKVVSVLLSAAMALSLCAGCSSSSSDTADTKAAEEKGADAADTEAGEAAEGVMPAVAKEDLKVGVIHIGNPADKYPYSMPHPSVFQYIQYLSPGMVNQLCSCL